MEKKDWLLVAGIVVGIASLPMAWVDFRVAWSMVAASAILMFIPIFARSSF